MAASVNATYLAQLIDPQVITDYIDQKFIDKLLLSPLSTFDYTLRGRDGDEITLPAYTPFIGTAGLVAEGTDIPISRLGTTTKKVKVTKIGKGVEITDEALLSGYQNNAADEAAKQILDALADGVEQRLFTAIDGVSTLTHTIGSSEELTEGVADALTKFGEDLDGEKVLLVSPSTYARLRKANDWIPNTEIGANIIIRGTVGMVHGCQVVPSNRLIAPVHYAKTSDVALDNTKTYYTLDSTTNVYAAVASPDVADIGDYYEKSTGSNDTAYIVKPGALRVYMKRDTLIEFDRDIVCQTNTIVGSKLFAPYVYDESKVIKVTLQ